MLTNLKKASTWCKILKKKKKRKEIIVLEPLQYVHCLFFP